jgi:hypothetical protein
MKPAGSINRPVFLKTTENNRIATLRESISSSGYARRVYSLNLSTGVRFGIGSPPLIAIVVLDGDSAHTASCHTPCISF